MKDVTRARASARQKPRSLFTSLRLAVKEVLEQQRKLDDQVARLTFRHRQERDKP